MFSLGSKILITGSRGLVGTALIDELKAQGYTNIIPLTREQCDLTNFADVKSFFNQVKPDVVFHIAASVYGIGGNAVNKGSIFLDNNLMNTHVIESSRLSDVKKIIAMGTIAAYPHVAIAPIREEDIWSGPPHRSEGSYGHAKRAMLAHLEAYHENYNLDYAYVISTNLYGPHDKFDIRFGHVIPSLVRKFYEAKVNETDVQIWGDGTASRDFLYSKDMAHALFLIMNHHSGSINIASGKETKIRDAVAVLGDYFDIQSRVKWDPSKPNGRSYCPIDLQKMQALPFAPSHSLESGLKETIDWFCANYAENLVRI
jgi:GDP-L-fucose synthase